jgi:hypothetical protein
MARRGKELEKLVEALERLLVHSGASVTSPDFLIDRTTGKRREVDVSVRSRVGSIEVVVILECRDWSIPQCSPWIEQLAQKRDDVNAAKAVAVSSSGFNEAAAKKAHAHGIELRRIEEINLAAVEEWCRVNRVTISQRNFDFLDFGIGLRSRPSAVSSQVQVHGSLRDATFMWRADGSRKNARELLMTLDPHAQLWSGIPTTGERVRRKFRLDFRALGVRVGMIQGGSVIDLAGVEGELEMWLLHREVPLNRVVSYRSNEETFVESVEYLVELDGIQEIFAISRDLRTGKQYLSRRPVVPGTPLPDAWVRTEIVPLTKT